MNVTLDNSFVDEWAARYRADMGDEERELFAEVGPAVRKRGYLTKDDFRRIGRWKTTRVSKILDTVPDVVIEQISRAAFSVTDERVSILSALPGVKQGRASAILTVWDPDRYTVIDWRAIQTLEEAGYFTDWATDPPYGAYLEVCRDISAKLSLQHIDVTPLRELDRALWKYSETKSA